MTNISNYENWIYGERIKMKKFEADIIQIGAYPPPLGGISVHVKRLTERIKAAGDISCAVYSHSFIQSSREEKIYRIKNSYIFYCFFYIMHKCKIVHYHNMDWGKRFLLALLKHSGVKLVITFHSFRDSTENKSFLECFIYRTVYKKADVIIAVSEDIKNKLISTECPESKIVLMPAVIFPFNQDYILNKNEQNIIDDALLGHDYIILANSSNNSHFNGQDLYGIDMSIELIRRLKQDGISTCCIFFISNINDTSYFESLVMEIQKYNLEKDFIFIKSKEELIKYMGYLSGSKTIFIRPTNTDGDAISIREALYSKIPAIASDVTARPKGTLLFKTRNMDDLYDVTVNVMDHYIDYKKNLDRLKSPDYAGKMLNIYKKLIGKGN